MHVLLFFVPHLWLQSFSYLRNSRVNCLYFLYFEKRFEIKAVIVEFLYDEYFILRKKIVFDLTFLYCMYVCVFLRFCIPYKPFEAKKLI
jgi:hypothetical protein